MCHRTRRRTGTLVEEDRGKEMTATFIIFLAVLVLANVLAIALYVKDTR